jgi:hypothetical protein
MVKLSSLISLKKENIAPLIFTIILVLFVLTDYQLKGQIAGIVFGLELVALSLLSLFIMFWAGFTVMKALAFVAAELSLLIYLGQSYCGLPSRTTSGDNALKALLVVGILYISFYFFQSLYRGLSEKYKKLKDEKRSWEKVVFITLFIIFVAFYIWVVWQVVAPIIFNLCIY